jgi:hypothetical protein
LSKTRQLQILATHFTIAGILQSFVQAFMQSFMRSLPCIQPRPYNLSSFDLSRFFLYHWEYRHVPVIFGNIHYAVHTDLTACAFTEIESIDS